MRSIFLLLIALIFTSAGAEAASNAKARKKLPPVKLLQAVTIVDPNRPASSGVYIHTDEWKADTHADDTYREFSDYQKLQGKKLGRFDYYYRLEIVPQFADNVNECEQSEAFGRFLNGLFGVSEGGLVTVKASVKHRWSYIGSTDILKGDAPLVIAAKGASSSVATSGNGCYFDSTSRPTFPWILWNGGGRAKNPVDDFDDFQIKFTVNGGKTKQYNLVSNVVSLFSSASAASRWANLAVPLSSEVFGGFEKAASSFQGALQSAGTLQWQISKSATLKAWTDDELRDAENARILISIPNLFNEDGADEQAGKRKGSIAVYVRRQASIALRGTADISAERILATAELAYRQCSIGQISAGTCDSKDNPDLRLAMAKALKGVDDKIMDSNPVAPVFVLTPPEKPAAAGSENGKSDTVIDRRTRVFDLCRAMRHISTQQMHLSTLDEIVVRWAFTEEAGLQEKLAAASKDDSTKEQFAKDFGRPWQDVVQQCWNEGDDKVLSAVVSKLQVGRENRKLLRRPFPKGVSMNWPPPEKI